MYYMRELDPDAKLAAYAWDHFAAACSSYQDDTLKAALALSEPPCWFDRVGDIVADESREEALRSAAIHALGKAGARDIIAANLPLLLRPPVLTWSIHQALVQWALELDLDLLDLSHLQDVDHLTVQTMLASIAAAK